MRRLEQGRDLGTAHTSRTGKRSRLRALAPAALAVMALFAVSAQPALAQHGINPPPPAPGPAPGPTITSFTPTAGTTGSTVTITGTGFASTTQVGFNGFGPASFAVVSDTTLSAIVPALATTGPIQVITNGGLPNVGNVFSSTVFTVTNPAPPPPPPPPTQILGVSVRLIVIDFAGNPCFVPCAANFGSAVQGFVDLNVGATAPPPTDTVVSLTSLYP